MNRHGEIANSSLAACTRRRMKRSNTSLGVTVLAFVAGGVLGLASPYRLHASIPKTTVGPSGRATAPLASAGIPEFLEIAARSAPAVVGIAAAPGATGVGRVGSALDPGAVSPTYSPDDPFFRFFRYLPISHAIVRADSLGSGFIISPDGIILTNAHLVRDASQVAVMLADRRKFEAKILGVDLLTDVAVLKIDALNLPTVRVGKSTDLAIGESVLVLGHPYGLDENAASGIVRAMGRSASLVPFIRTDVAAHLGDSGGPLVDAQGRVVGISAQISTGPASYDRVSYAIPINVALHVKDDVARTDERAQPGIEFEPLTPSLVSVCQCPDITGSLMTRVVPESIAASAGLRPGNLVLRYSRRPVINSQDNSSEPAVPLPEVAMTAETLRDGRVFTTRLLCCGQLSRAGSSDGRIGDLPAYPRRRIGFPTRPTPPQG